MSLFISKSIAGKGRNVDIFLFECELYINVEEVSDPITMVFLSEMISWFIKIGPIPNLIVFKHFS